MKNNLELIKDEELEIISGGSTSFFKITLAVVVGTLLAKKIDNIPNEFLNGVVDIVDGGIKKFKSSIASTDETK